MSGCGVQKWEVQGEYERGINHPTINVNAWVSSLLVARTLLRWRPTLLVARSFLCQRLAPSSDGLHLVAWVSNRPDSPWEAVGRSRQMTVPWNHYRPISFVKVRRLRKTKKLQSPKAGFLVVFSIHLDAYGSFSRLPMYRSGRPNLDGSRDGAWHVSNGPLRSVCLSLAGL